MQPPPNTIACSTCPAAGNPPSGAGVHCSIRELDLADPGRTYCANHPSHSPQRDRHPVGPVMLRSGEESRVVHRSPDRESIRQNLLAIADRIEVHDLSELTFRERMALWQLREFRETRAFVHFDRISLDATARPDTPATPRELELLVLSDMFRTIVGDHPDGPDANVPFIERITLAARLLAVASLIAGGLTFYGLFVFLYEDAPAGTWVSVGLVLLIAFAAGVAVWASGVFVLRRMRIQFWIPKQGPGAGTSGAAQPLENTGPDRYSRTP